jgi:RNA polymerase sigma-70 factor (ECF subfamily)
MAAYYARHCPEEADDLQQEAWLGVFEALPRLDVRIGDPEQYLLRYARWRLLDAVRRSLLHEPVTALDEQMVDADALPDALDTLGLRVFLSQLTPIQRKIVACLLAGFTWREAGDTLGCTSANVAYHVRRIGEQYQDWCEHAPTGAAANAASG